MPDPTAPLSDEQLAAVQARGGEERCECGHTRSGHASIDGSKVFCLNCRCREYRIAKEAAHA